MQRLSVSQVKSICRQEIQLINQRRDLRGGMDGEAADIHIARVPAAAAAVVHAAVSRVVHVVVVRGVVHGGYWSK